MSKVIGMGVDQVKMAACKMPASGESPTAAWRGSVGLRVAAHPWSLGMPFRTCKSNRERMKSPGKVNIDAIKYGQMVFNKSSKPGTGREQSVRAPKMIPSHLALAP